jgi:hypothetical protein
VIEIAVERLVRGVPVAYASDRDHSYSPGYVIGVLD